MDCDKVSPVVSNCTFWGYSANTGGGIYHDTTSSFISNTIFRGNTATTSGDQLYNFDNSSPSIMYCDIEGTDLDGSANDNFNIDADPLFVSTVDESEDFHLKGESPCVNAGSNDALPSDTTDIDGDANTVEQIPYALEGNTRIQSFTVDMGAYKSSYG